MLPSRPYHCGRPGIGSVVPAAWQQPEKGTAGETGATVPRPAGLRGYRLVAFPVDREADDKVLAPFARIMDAFRRMCYFTARAARHLAAGAGGRQFLDFGTGLPFAGLVHETALSVAGGCRIACAGNDPLVFVFALLRQARGFWRVADQLPGGRPQDMHSGRGKEGARGPNRR